MRRSIICCMLALALAGGAHRSVAQVIFTDDMSSGTNWTVAQDPDTTFEFGYDYSADGLPAAPGGTDTVGLKLTVNNTLPAEIASIGVFNENSAYTGQYTLRVDVWSNWAADSGGAGSGTTEFVGITAGHDGIDTGPLGASFMYAADGDAGNSEYRLFKEATQLQSESGQYALGNVAGARNNSNPIIEAAFPSVLMQEAAPGQGQTGTVVAGAAGFQWMTLNMEVDTDTIGPSGETSRPGFARVTMQSNTSGNILEIGTIDYSLEAETEPVFLEDIVGLLMADTFSSVTLNPVYSFSIFDNVRVLEGLVPLDPVQSLPGDFNSDGKVDILDLDILSGNFGTSMNATLADGDANNDGAVDILDLDILSGNFGAMQSNSTAVPELSSVSLAAIAAVCLVAISAQRRQPAFATR